MRGRPRESASASATSRYQGADGRGRRRLDVEVTDRSSIDVTIDFAGVEAMTFSFVDEFLGKFLDAFAPARVHATVKLAGLGNENLEAVTVCLERRKSQVLNLGEDGVLRLLGDQTEILAETFDAARALGTFRANDLAEALGLSPPNVNNRLKRLSELGALRKGRGEVAGRGGREFRYEVPSAELPDSAVLANA